MVVIRKTGTNSGKHVGKLEASHIAGENVKEYNFGTRFGSSSKCKRYELACDHSVYTQEMEKAGYTGCHHSHTVGYNSTLKGM